jgi:hypothetical protein
MSGELVNQSCAQPRRSDAAEQFRFRPRAPATVCVHRQSIWLAISFSKSSKQLLILNVTGLDIVIKDMNLIRERISVVETPAISSDSHSVLTTHLLEKKIAGTVRINSVEPSFPFRSRHCAAEYSFARVSDHVVEPRCPFGRSE